MSRSEQEQLVEGVVAGKGEEGVTPSSPGGGEGAPAQPSDQGPAGEGGGSAAQPASGAATPAEEGQAEGEDQASEATEEQEAAEQQLQVDMEALLAAAAQRDEYLALAQRTQADFENYKKRVAKETAAAIRRGIVQLAKELLPALDNLERALAEAGAREGEQEDPFVAGIKLVHRELKAALERVGISAYTPLGEQFDPNSQEAMAQREVQEGEQPGTVVEVYQPGYRLEELVIRPARVVVAV
jgi:molecular chaperone GrpE